MAHRQSIVTKGDMAHADNALHLLFKTFGDDEDQLGPAAFLQLVNEAGLLDDACGRAVPSSAATLAFSRAKLGKKNALSFDRFKEAARMVAVEKGVAYQDLVPFAVNTFRARRAAQERIDLEAATRFTVTLDRGEDRGLGVVLFIEEEIPNRLRVDEVNEDSAAGRYNTAVEKERADAAATAATAPAVPAPAPAAGGEEEDDDDDDAAARDTDDDGEDDSGGIGGQRLAIELGDYVVEVNGLVVEGRPLLEVLEEMRKPTLRLTFMRLGAPGDTGAAADEAAAAAAVAAMGGGGAAAAAGVAAGTILKAAWLYKQGHLVKNWKRRYFEMVADADGGASLKYYGGEQQGSQMKGCFKLEPPGTVAEERGERAVGKMPGMDGGNHTMHQFAIHCGRRMLLVGAPDAATMRRWVSCCSLVIADGAGAAARAGWLGEGSAKRGAAAGTATLPQRRQSQTRGGGQQRVKARMSITPYLVHATAYAAKEGWLFKQGAEGLSKRKRWFVLEGDRLKYFQGNSKAPSTLKGEIQLTANTACARQVGTESQARVDLMTEKRVYVLFASDGGKQSAEAEALMGEWVAALSNNLSVLKTANSRAAAANDSIAEEGEDGEAVAAQLGGAGAPLAGGLVRSGNLWKQGRIAKSWKQRWFELSTPARDAAPAGGAATTKTVLRYYVGEGGAQKGEFDLSKPPVAVEALGCEDGAAAGGGAGEAAAAKSTGPRVGKAAPMWRLQVRCRDRTLIMGAPDERAMMAWVEALRTAIFAAETIAHGGSRIKVRESKVGAGGGGGAGDMPLGIFHVRSGEAGDISGAINTQHLGVAYCM